MTHDRAEQIFGQLNERMDAEADKAERFPADVLAVGVATDPYQAEPFEEHDPERFDGMS